MPSSSGPAPLVVNLSVVPPGLPTGAQMVAAPEVLLAKVSSTDGPRQVYLYMPNRNVGSMLDPHRDTISQRFKTATDVAQAYCAPRLRHMLGVR